MAQPEDVERLRDIARRLHWLTREWFETDRPTRPPWWRYTGTGGRVLGLGATGWALIAAAAVAFAAWRISSEYEDSRTPPEPAPGGPPCGNSALAQVTFPAVTGWSFRGGTAAYRDAEAKARAACAANAALCAGACAPGKTCKPNLSVQDVSYGSYALFSTVTMTFRCPCECY